jgi:hypothetical protein
MGERPLVNFNRLTRIYLLNVIFGIGVVCFWGCGNSHKVPVSRITGRVTIDQKPVESGRIVFESPNQRPASGEIRDGEIVEMTTYTPGDGVPLGKHQVAIFVLKEPEAANKATVSHPGDVEKFDSRSMTLESLIPSRYNHPKTSGLSAEVTAGGKNHFEFDIQSK